MIYQYKTLVFSFMDVESQKAAMELTELGRSGWRVRYEWTTCSFLYVVCERRVMASDQTKAFQW